jgi:hypothetical protein
MNESELVCVGMTSNTALAHIWRHALEAEGIPCQVGESLTEWLGSVTPWAQADLWVHRANAAKARHILEGHRPTDSPPRAAARR